MSTLYYSKLGTTRSCEDTHIMNLSSLIYLGVVTCQKVHLKIIVGQQKPKIWRPIFVLFKLFYTKGLNKHVCKGLSPHILERERKGEGGVERDLRSRNALKAYVIKRLFEECLIG